MNSLGDSKAVLIAGPTASGKSALALELAQKAGGVIVNADSMQVYRDLRVITARPTPDEEALVPHRLYGHVDAAVNFSAGSWVADAAGVLALARTQNRLPICLTCQMVNVPSGSFGICTKIWMRFGILSRH